LKNALVLALVASTAIGCATAQDGKPAADAKAASPAKTACAPAPKELVVKDLRPGTGQAIRFRSAVNVFYTGWVYDGCKPDFKGAQFDSNAGGPLPFSLMVGAGRVIKGWDEGLIGMKEKGKRMLIIPPDKAYGEREVAGGKIPASSTLVFEVDLVQIVYQPPAEPAKPQ
jgi:FKBP-type peptidyl-prolyl cis-trans isomerase